MNPRRNVIRKRRANKRMGVFLADPFRPVKRYARLVGRAIATMNRKRDAWNRAHPLPESFKSGGIVSTSTGEEFVIPLLK